MAEIWRHYSKKTACRKYRDSPSLQIKSQHWVGELRLSMEDVALEYYKNDNMFRGANSLYVFYSYPSEHNKQDTLATHYNTINHYHN